MKKNFTTDDLISLIQNLSAKEKKAFTNKIMDIMRTTDLEGDSKSLSCNNLVKERLEKEKPNCPHCQAKTSLGYIVKRGYKNGVQRYYCKSCGRYFVPATGTAFERTRKDAEVWEKYIELTISGATLKRCARECKIAYQTAFTWRHKILNAFRIHQETMTMSGKVELDEMLIPISYKGNHVQGEGFGQRRLNKDRSNNDMPRKSFKRGSDNRSYHPGDKACVFCMIKDGNKGFYATVPGVGYMNAAMLDKTVGKHVEKDDSIIIADQYRATASYLSKNNYNNIILAANTTNNVNGHKPEIRDGYHLQHINAMHMHLRKFLAKYCGVSTKYLENYISLYVWLKNVAANRQKKHTQKVSVTRVSSSDCYISRRGIESLPAVPMCA